MRFWMYTILLSALKAQFALTSKAHIVALPVALSVGFWIYLPALKYTVMEPDDKTNKQTNKISTFEKPNSSATSQNAWPSYSR